MGTPDIFIFLIVAWFFLTVYLFSWQKDHKFEKNVEIAVKEVYNES